MNEIATDITLEMMKDFASTGCCHKLAYATAIDGLMKVGSEIDLCYDNVKIPAKIIAKILRDNHQITYVYAAPNAVML